MAEYYYSPGHADEYKINGTSAEDYFNKNYPEMTEADGKSYEEMMRRAEQMPMCVSSGGSVFNKDEMSGNTDYYGNVDYYGP